MVDLSFLATGGRVRHRTVLLNVYMWMTLGLSLTAVEPGGSLDLLIL